MNKLVSIEKKNYIKKEYVIELGYCSVYDLVMEMLDNSYFEEGDIKEMVEICNYCKFLTESTIENEVIEAHNDWVENNYAYDWK